MANLSEVVTYEKEYPVEIVDHLTREKIGIRINVISKDSKRVVSALRDWQAEKWDDAAVKGDKEDTAKEKLQYIEDHGTETLIACISSWDWGEHSFDHISGAGEASDADKRYLVTHPNAGWIVLQIAAQVNNIENFTQPLRGSARNGSKKT